MQKALSRVKTHLVGAALISHNLEHCPSVGVCRPQSEAICRFARSGVRHVWQECSALPAYWPESSSIQTANSHSLSDRDSGVRLQCYSHFQVILSENPGLPNNLLMSDEAHFLLQGTVNKQNFRYSSVANPHELHQVAFMTQIYGLLCCLVQRSHWTLLLWGWRRTGHHSHIPKLHRDYQ